ncbi:MAG: ATP-binding cassette domain-containing protein [Bacteroidetes bacterium]|nr:ATP-binding cassette domain-containing protein [Bacteroidota bacterium]
MAGRRGRNRDDDSADAPPKGKLNKEGLHTLRRLYRYFRPYRFLFSVALVLLLLSSVTTMVFPYVIQQLLDKALAQAGSGNLAPINLIAAVLGIVVVAQAVISYFRVYIFSWVGQKAIAHLRQDLYRHIVELPLAFFGRSRVGELSSRIASDVSMIQDTFGTTLAEILRGILTFGIGMAFILWTSAELSLVMLLTIPVVIVAAMLFGRFIRKLSKLSQDKLAESVTIVEETLQGIHSVKSYANEYYEQRRYGNAIQQVLRVSLKAAHHRSAFVAFIVGAMFGAVVFILWYGAGMVAAGKLTVGELVGFVMYTFFVAGSMASFGQEITQVQRTIGATQRVWEILDEGREPIAPPDAAAPMISLEGAVCFREVGFAYPGAEEIPVLQDLSFEAQAGQRIALVGPSGAGKSTVVALIQRFYDPTLGSVLIDGKEITTYPVSALRRQMALVPQDVFLFGGTIRENIAYGKLDAGPEEIEAAARQAFAHDFIAAFPQGYDTVVGERGLKLSGGQRQRIAIARAILRNPRILILDEATSALDSESERLVQQALNHLMKERTTFIIAHRLSTIRAADTILVLQKGRLVEQGSHEALLAQQGLYAMLARLQFDSESV